MREIKGLDGCLSCALTNGVLRREVYGVCVEELEEGPVDRVRELVDLYHVLLIFRPLGAEHGPEMFTPAPKKPPKNTHVSI